MLDFPIGMFVILLFAIPNVAGIVLWRRRAFSCYLSTQLLIGVSGLCGLITVFVLENANTWTQIQTGSQVSAQSSYRFICLVYGGILLMFYIRFGRDNNKNAGNQ